MHIRIGKIDYQLHVNGRLHTCHIGETMRSMMGHTRFGNQDSYNFTINFKPTEISVDNQTISLTPQPVNFQIDTVNIPFGTGTVSLFVSFANTTPVNELDTNPFNSSHTIHGYFTVLQEMLDIKFYRHDNVSTGGSNIHFWNGFIGQNIEYPITFMFDQGDGRDCVAFLNGINLSAYDILYGPHKNDNGSNELIKMFWHYIRMLMTKKIFKRGIELSLNDYLINDYEKRRFEVEG